MQKKWTKLIALILVVLMLAGVIFSAVMGVLAKEDTTQTTGISATDWMAGIEDENKLSVISMPGTHDSTAQHVMLKFVMRCQDTSVEEQLQNGYRFFDLRVALENQKEGNPKLKMVHNFADCKKTAGLFAEQLYFEDVVSAAESFLKEHPTETVMFCIKAENDKDPLASVQGLLYEKIDENPELWYTQNTIPTLEEVRGKIVLATRFDDVNGVGDMRRGLCFEWENQGNKDVVEMPYALSMINDTEILWVQDRYKYNVENKIEALLEGVENCLANEETFFLNYSSTAGNGYVGRPEKYAGIINEALLETELLENTSYGVVIVDYGTEQLARHIFETNFSK